MSYSYEDFELMDNDEKADIILNELSYRLYQNLKRMDTVELVKLGKFALTVCDVLESVD